ncbi:MAG: hypothetical protein IPK63_17955 [Candidatus Competibacteraceae bacterium]|nr:hypothetical protein [Candidatus Competibacteraceae bacterium]
MSATSQRPDARGGPVLVVIVDGIGIALRYQWVTTHDWRWCRLRAVG